MPRHDRNIVETMNIRQLYDCAQLSHGCGYYPVCFDRTCPCDPSSYVKQGFDINIWDHMADAFDRAVAEFHRSMADED